MNVLIRADASTQVGLGHAMRCLALAQECRAGGGRPIFALAQELHSLEHRLDVEGIDFMHLNVPIGTSEDATETSKVARARGLSWIIADGYRFGADYQRSIKALGLSLLALDDYGQCSFYSADLVLNPNLHALAETYHRREPSTRLLLGPYFAPLRQEFLNCRPPRRPAPELARKILVTLGGGDPDNITLKVLRALRFVETHDLEIRVVIGGANPHQEALAAEVESSPFTTTLLRNVTAMPDLMIWADMAISAGGSTCWEMAFLGLPAALIVAAENQRLIAASLGTTGSAIDLGWHESVSEKAIASGVSRILSSADLRTKMSEIGRSLVDGQGSKRVIAAMCGQGAN